MRHAGCSALRQHPARRIPGAAQFWPSTENRPSTKGRTAGMTLK